MKTKSLKLEYLSEVMDSETGDISKPFTINGKNYQMVRAITPDRKKVMGVYCMDEVNEDGSNKIYEISEFEETIANKHLKKENTMNTETKPNFEGYKHFIVNNKTGKARKFKSIEELAKAQMGENEKYMGVKEFKKFVDEALFGMGKKGMVKELDAAGGDDMGQGDEGDMQIKAKKLIDLIQKKIPSQTIQSIKSNKLAQREVIATFAEMIGVPRNGLTQLVGAIKDLAKPNQQDAAVNESKKTKIIKKKDIK
jgi:hypothetical protein